MNKKKIKKADWLQEIYRFLYLKGIKPMLWEDVLELEGGYGKDKIKSVEDAMKPENKRTWPGIWFGSEQKDFSAYDNPQYLYSLLFARQNISGGTVSHFIKDLRRRRKKNVTVVDWGGSIFTAADIAQMGADIVDAVILTNLPGPQLDFAWHIIDGPGERENIWAYEASEIEHIAKHTWDAKRPVVFLFSEVLEHEPAPLIYYLNLVPELWIEDAYIANSFCTPAYGHHIPILIDGRDCYTTRQANAAWRKALDKRGFSQKKVEGWNSRLWHVQTRNKEILKGP